MTDLHERYRAGKERIAAFARELTPEQLAAPVPACPGWSVRDTLAHLVANADDGVGGRMSGIPDDAQTGAQVQARRDLAIGELLAQWDAAFPAIEHLIVAAGDRVAPIVMDLLTHEQDIRGALGRPGHRDSDDLRWAAALLVGRLSLPRTVAVTTETDELLVGGPPTATPLRLTTTNWELCRLRMGRRSRPQAAALSWSEDPGDALDRWFIFGPATADIVE